MSWTEDMFFLSGVGRVFLYISYITEKNGIVHNFRLNDANDFIFGPQHIIKRRNIFWFFFENPTWWRHVTSRDVIFAKFAQKGADVIKNVHNVSVNPHLSNAA